MSKNYCSGLLIVIVMFLVYSTVPGQKLVKDKTNSIGLAPSILQEVKAKEPSLTGSFCNSKLGYLQEGFENAVFPPAGWKSVNVKGSAIWERVTDASNSGVASAFIDYDYPEGEDWLITPAVNISNGSTISFFVKRQFSSNYPPDYLYVIVSTDTALSSFTVNNQIFAIDINSLTAGQFIQFNYDLTAYSGQNIYIAFKHADADGNGCYLDDIKIGTQPNYDVGVFSIDIPNNVVPGAFIPKVTVKNFGLNTANLNVTLNIGNNYTSTKSVTNLESNATMQVSFDPINFATGTYNVLANTTLIGNTDENPANNSASKTVICSVADVIYGYNAYGTGVATGTVFFNSTSPDVLNLMQPYSTNFLAGSAHTPNGDYGIYYSSNQFVSWNINNGTLTNLGVITPPDGEWTGMTYDPNTGKLLASCYGNSNVICTIDPLTLQTNVIATNSSALIIGIAANGDGNIYYVDIVNNAFGKYNYATNTFSQISIFSFDVNYAQSLEFNYDNGKLYYASYDNVGRLRVINHLTGEVTLIGDFQGGSEIDGIFTNSSGFIPVELVLFNAVKGDNNTVNINWTTATEINNDRFEIYRRYNNSNWELIGTVKGSGNSTEPIDYTFTDRINQVGDYYYQLKQVDFDGTYSYSKVVFLDNNLAPANYELKQNYPNPFNPSTNIEFSLPKGTKVTLSIYDVLGNLVSVLENGYLEAGNYKYEFNGKNLSSGVYYYKLSTDNFVQTKKMILIK